MKVIEVLTAMHHKQFMQLPLSIYRNDANYIKPLNKDVEEVFDPEKNKFFKSGNCRRWILLDDTLQVIGRIAAFHTAKYKMEQPTGGIGFFECINNQSAANILFDTAKAWLTQEGMEAMDGPINFGERDKWWGLQVFGFEPPLYGMNYNLPYYKQLFEAYGFLPYFYQECFGRKVHEGGLSDKFYQRHETLSKDKNYTAKMVKKTELEKYAKDFTTVYNKAWAAHGQGKSMSEKQAVLMFKSMKAVLDERIAWFAYYKNEPIAFWINLPDLNEYFKDFKGRLGLLEKIRFVIKKSKANAKRMVGIVFGVVPEFQAKGVDAYLIVEGSKVIWAETNYQEYEMQWIGDFNPKMINIAKSLEADITRRLCTYRYLFDRSKPFERCPIVR